MNPLNTMLRRRLAVMAAAAVLGLAVIPAGAVEVNSDSNYRPHRPPRPSAPEISAKPAPVALAFLAGCLLLVTDRGRRSRKLG